MIVLLLFACKPTPDDCSLSSTVPRFSPDCDTAALYRYPGESRLIVPGTQEGTLIAWLPEELDTSEYGGTSGNPLDVSLELGDAQTWATDRTTTLTFASLGHDEAELRLHADFSEGVVSGPLAVPVTWE